MYGPQSVLIWVFMGGVLGMEGAFAERWHDPERITGLAALAALLPPGASPADAPAQHQGRTRTPAHGDGAGVIAAHPRSRPRSWPCRNR